MVEANCANANPTCGQHFGNHFLRSSLLHDVDEAQGSHSVGRSTESFVLLAPPWPGWLPWLPIIFGLCQAKRPCLRGSFACNMTTNHLNPWHHRMVIGRLVHWCRTRRSHLAVVTCLAWTGLARPGKAGRLRAISPFDGENSLQNRALNTLTPTNACESQRTSLAP